MRFNFDVVVIFRVITIFDFNEKEKWQIVEQFDSRIIG